MKKKIYERPQIEIVEKNAAGIICTSMTSPQNEGYGNGTTEGWY